MKKIDKKMLLFGILLCLILDYIISKKAKNIDTDRKTC